MAASGTSPPVSSLACTEMSGCVPRRLEGLKGPRRVRPVKTSSKRIGKPVQVLGVVGAGEAEKRE